MIYFVIHNSGPHNRLPQLGQPSAARGGERAQAVEGGVGGEDRQVPRQAPRHVQGGGHDGVPQGKCFDTSFCETAQKATAADSNAHCPFVIYAKHESCAKKLKFTAGQTRYTKVHKKSNFNSWFF